VQIEDKNIVRQAFHAAIDACGGGAAGRRKMLFALGITEARMHQCIKKQKVHIKVALKLQVLTRTRYKWPDLCPAEYREINDVSKFCEQ
jgi:hypothetical protein